jgi:hypothetical protein
MKLIRNRRTSVSLLVCTTYSEFVLLSVLIKEYLRTLALSNLAPLLILRLTVTILRGFVSICCISLHICPLRNYDVMV